MRHGIVRFIKTWKQEILLAFIAIVSVWGSVQLISASLRVHLDELEINLQNSNFMDGGVSHLPLVARFEQQRRLLNDSISKQQLDSSELQMAALSMNSSTKSNQGIEASTASEFISVYIINGLRKIMGKPPLPEMNVTKTIDNLDLAFYYERTKQYKKALLLYDQILQHDIPYDIRASILLHKGFCYGVQGDFTPAKYYLQQVISKPANAEISETALQLLNYLISFEQETMQLAQSEGTSFEKVESLSKLWQCKEALAEIAKVNMDVLTKEQKSSLQYYQGMCLEEMGDKKAAVKSYVAAIKSAGNSDMARDANRRIFIVGHQDEENGESMRNVALQLNESLQDSSLDTLVAIADSMPKAPPAPEEPLLVQAANTTNKESTDTAITTTTMDTMDTLQTMDPIDTAMDTMDEMDTPQITQSEPKASYDTTDFLAFIENEVAAVEKEIAQNTPTLEPEDDAMDATKQEELIEEKAIKKEAPAPKKVTLYSPVRLTTKDGKAFYGILMTDKNAPIIKVQTMIGMIGVAKDEIGSISAQ